MRSDSRAIAWVASPAARPATSTRRFGASSASSTVTVALGSGPDQNFSPVAGAASASRVSSAGRTRSKFAVSVAAPRGRGTAIGPTVIEPPDNAIGADPSGMANGPLSSAAAKR